MSGPITAELRREYGDNLLSPVQIQDAFAFAAVDITEDKRYDRAWRPTNALVKYRPLKKRSRDVYRWCKAQMDALWVRARVERLFQITTPPEDQRGEKCCFDQAFVAARSNDDGSFDSTVFVASDHYGTTWIYFPEPMPETDLCSAIAAAFWELLLARPEDIHDFTDRMYHSGVGVMVKIGLRQGIPFMEDDLQFTEEQVPTPPCPQCGKPLRTAKARQCFECGADWHGQ